MSSYVQHVFTTGDSYTAAVANALEGRIDTAGDIWEGTMAGLQSAIDALDDASTGRVSLLEATQNNILQTSAVADTYSFAAGDLGKCLETQVNSNAKTWTLPASLGTLGSVIEIFNRGTGTITVAAAAGVSIVSPGGVVTITQQYATARLRKRQVTGGSEIWALSGNIG